MHLAPRDSRNTVVKKQYHHNLERLCYDGYYAVHFFSAANTHFSKLCLFFHFKHKSKNCTHNAKCLPSLAKRCTAFKISQKQTFANTFAIILIPVRCVCVSQRLSISLVLYSWCVRLLFECQLSETVTRKYCMCKQLRKNYNYHKTYAKISKYE